MPFDLDSLSFPTTRSAQASSDLIALYGFGQDSLDWPMQFAQPSPKSWQTDTCRSAPLSKCFRLPVMFYEWVIVFTASFDVLCQRLFGGPMTSTEPGPQRRHADSAALTPLCEGFCSVAQSQPVVIRAISHLFVRCGPADIARGVMAIVVFTIKTVRRRWLETNLCEKCRELFEFWSDTNSTRTVMCERSAFRISAALMHAPPCVVLGRSMHAVFDSH